jgi:flavin-dependent dehydrogenase
MPIDTPRHPMFDTVVVGAGIGGLAAAIRSIELEQRVLMVEKSDQPGGSAAMSAGILWTAPDADTLRAVLPNGDQELCGIVVSEHNCILDPWME